MNGSSYSQWKNYQYYVCDYKTLKAIHGPWESKQVVDFIVSQPNQTDYCNMSRYQLSKKGVYPNTKAGNAKLEADLKLV
jgi:hypothetical protein